MGAPGSPCDHAPYHKFALFLIISIFIFQIKILIEFMWKQKMKKKNWAYDSANVCVCIYIGARKNFIHREYAIISGEKKRRATLYPVSHVIKVGDYFLINFRENLEM